MQTLVFTLVWIGIQLQELAIRVDLYGQQERHVQHGWTLAEILADALLFSERVGHGVGTASELWSARGR